MLQKFLNRFTVSTKLYFLVFVLSSIIVLIGAYGLNRLNTMNNNFKDIYSNRILCMDQLLNIRYAYAKNIVFTLQELKDKQVSYAEAQRRMKLADKSIADNWNAYKQTYFTPEEVQLAKVAEAVMHSADSVITVEKIQLSQSDTNTFATLNPQKSFKVVLPVVDKLNALLDLQVRVSKELMDKNELNYIATKKKFYALIVASLFFGLALFLCIFYDIRVLIRNLINSYNKTFEGEAKYRYLFKNSPAFIILWDPETLKVLEVNNSVFEKYGYSKEEWTKMTVLDYRPKEDYPKIRELAKKVLTEDVELRIGRWRHLKKNGESMQMEISSHKIVYNGKVAVLSLALDLSEQEKAEQDLKKSEERNKAVIENISDAIFLMDKNTVSYYHSPSVKKVFGYTFEETKGKTVFSFIHPDEVEEALPFFKKIASSPGVVFHNQFRARHKDGHYIWVEGTAINMLDDEDVHAIILNCRDITERKEAEDMFKDLVEKNLAGVYIYDYEKFVYVNPRLAEIFGYSKEEILAMEDAIQIVYENDHDKVKESLGQRISEDINSYHYTARIKRKNGDIIWVEIIGSVTTYKSKKASIGTVLDVTERLKTQDELKKQESEFRAVFDNLENASCLLDTEKRYVVFNKQFIKDHVKLTYTEPKVGQLVYDLFPPEIQAERHELIDRVLKTGNKEVIETDSIRNGKRICFRTTFNPVISDDKVIGVSTLSIDLSDIKEAQQEIHALNESLENKVTERTNQLAMANKELESFSYSVTHDLRTPLTIIHGYAQILADQKSKFDAETNVMLQAIADNGIRMAQLIDDMLGFSKIVRKELNIEPVDMTTIAKNALQEILISKGTIKAKVIIHNLLPAYADEPLMIQVFSNLLSNAIKYSAKKENPEVVVSSYKKGEEHIYCIKDNGAGFDMKQYDKLFGVFQRLHSSSEFEGTGVGLPLVKRIIERHGGRVWAEGEPGQGATFYFSLPAKSLY